MTDEAIDPGMSRTAQVLRKRAFAAADRVGLDREERIEFSQMLLKTDADTWGSFTESEFARLVDALDGAHLVDTLRALRSPQPAREPGVVEGEQPALRE